MLKKSKPDKKAGSGKSLAKTLAVDVLAAIIIAVVVLQIISPVVVRQTSMKNTLSDKDYMVLYKLAYVGHGPERGDIVVFKSDLIDPIAGKRSLLIKRVVGLPGDVVEIKDEQLYLNGAIYHEDYLLSGKTPTGDIPKEGQSYTVPEGNYFCMGDNREVSMDSRSSSVGSVPLDSIEGKVVLRLFPLDKIRTF